MHSSPRPDTTPPSASNFRWFICGLLFLATTINYMDRQIIGILKVSLSTHYHWTENDYGDIVAAFQLAYALGYLVAGRMMDWIGVRWGFPIVVGLWSLAAGAHGLLQFVPADNTNALSLHILGWTFSLTASVMSFGLLRIALGLFEGGHFPASIKVVAEWFPTKERAFATGIFNTGTNIGAMICPALVPWITWHWGWPGAFYAVGGLGIGWVVLWIIAYKRPARDPDANAELSATKPQISWIGLLRFRATWAFVVGMLLTSPVWWFYLFWIPGFLQKRFSLSGDQISLPVMFIYFIAIFGSIGGGWLAEYFLGRGMRLGRARKISMLICAVSVLPVFFASVVPNLWMSVIIVAVAASAHQGWAANLYTLVSDTIPKDAVSSVVGMGGLAGGLAGAVTAKVCGIVLDATGGNYFVLFAAVSVMYVLALVLIHLLTPRLD
jgi:ACS family hexuronate transporter-like MFS transporter